MHDLTKGYNRRFYKRIFIIKSKTHWKLLKISIISNLLKLCNKIDSGILFSMIIDLNKDYEMRKMNEDYEMWEVNE